jgi:hypothetical protein
MIQIFCGILIRFRLHKIESVAVIEKAFLQICLQTNQRDVTMFMWLKDITLSYISTTENPADIASRGTSVNGLMRNKLWWHRPPLAQIRHHCK